MFVVWSDNENEAAWFIALDKRLAGARTQTIKGRGMNPAYIDELVHYDRPDIILCHNDRPIMVLEKTQEVPTGHNVGQRFARLVRAIEHNVPTLYFLPFDARKHGAYSSMCYLNVRLLKALERLSDLHGAPAVAVNWPCKTDGNLVWSGEENIEVAELVSEIVSEGLPGPRWSAQRREQRKQWLARTSIRPEYADFPDSVQMVSTATLPQTYAIKLDQMSERARARDNSAVYTMDMAPDKCKRQDPYTGMQFIYDYGWLRNGPRPENRTANLFLHIPRVDVRTWLVNNPEDYTTKSCNWYLAADGIILSDGFISITTWPSV